jgi:hypothetical protein
MDLLIALALFVAALLLCCVIAAIWFSRRSRASPAQVTTLLEPAMRPNRERTLRMRFGAEDPFATRALAAPADQPQVAGAAVPAAAASLMLQGGHQTPLSIDSPVILGRKGDVHVSDPTVSRMHASIWAIPGGQEYWIKDLQSTRGTYVNGQPVHGPRRLVSGDVIQLGDSTVVFLQEGRCETGEAQTQPSFTAPTVIRRGPSQFDAYERTARFRTEK